jgi:uncharacterized protein (TIGR00369 family)
MLPFDETPFNRALGFQLRNQSGGMAEVIAPMQPWFAQENGVIHGGVLSSLADTAGVYAVRATLESKERMTGIEFKINFVRAATCDDVLVARGRLVRRGRSIAVCDVGVYQRDELVATGLFTYLISGT